MRKKYNLIDTFDNKTLGTGTFKELSKEFNISIDHIKWSYYHKTIVMKRYLVVDKS